VITVDGALLDWLADLPAPPALPCRKAIEAVRRLGGLAPWWLRPAVLACAARRSEALRGQAQRPALPASLAACWIALELKHQVGLLRPAVLLPLRWQTQTSHSDRLPQALRHLADMVVEQFDAAGWGLHLHDEADLKCGDLGRLSPREVTGDSGWASLAGGLVLARQGRLPRTDVWASAAWHPKFGIGPVEGLPAKLELAREWDVKRIFVPAENERDALEALAGRNGIKVEVLRPTEKPDPLRLLRGYLAGLGAEPGPDEPLATRMQHYENILTPRDADDYYRRCLLHDAAQRCAGHLRQDEPSWQPTHVVTVVSPITAIVALGPLVIGAKRCLLLHEVDAEEQVPQEIHDSLTRVRTHLAEQGVECVLAPLLVGERETERRQIEKHLLAFCKDVPADKVVFDLTPGYKSLSLALAELAASGSWFIYCRNRHKHNRPEPERYDRWQREERQD
jgi:hypothetical protein